MTDLVAISWEIHLNMENNSITFVQKYIPSNQLFSKFKFNEFVINLPCSDWSSDPMDRMGVP